MILSRIHGRPAQGGDRAGSPGKVTPAVPEVQSSSKWRSVGAGQSLRASHAHERAVGRDVEVGETVAAQQVAVVEAGKRGRA